MGHFHSDITINGVKLVGMIDTGASSVLISAATAHSMGITPEGGRLGLGQNANGGMITVVTKVVPVVKIGPIVLNDVEIAVTANAPIPLIGMSVLRRLKVSAANGQMVLSK